MKTVIMIIGLLIFGAIAYYGYSYGAEKSADISMQKESDEVVENVKSVMTEVVEEESAEEKTEADIAVKSAIEENIPVEEESEEVPEEEETLVEEDKEDIIENEESIDTNDSENLDAIIEEQEALMDEAVREEGFDSKKGEGIKELKLSDETDDEAVEKSAPILETEEEKIIREEEEQNQAAIEEDNVSE